MNLKLNAEEMCVICVMAWPGPLPPFQGVQGVLPYGVKNAIKWKSKLGLKKLIRNQHEKLKKNKIWGKKEFNDMLMSVLFFNQAYSFVDVNKNFVTFYEGTEGNYSSICSKNSDEYEIRNYTMRENWYNEIMHTYHELKENEKIELFTVIHHRWGNNKKEIRDKYSAIDWDVRMIENY